MVKILLENIKLDQYLQTWNNSIKASSKGKTCMILKLVLKLEQYFIKLPEKI